MAVIDSQYDINQVKNVLWTFFVILPMIDCHYMEMAWYKHFINISLQRNFHSSDSGSLVIDCLARWGGHFPQKANVQCKSIHTFSERKCWMFLPKYQVYPIFSTECHWISFSNGHPDPPRLQRLLWAVTEGKLNRNRKCLCLCHIRVKGSKLSEFQA